MAFLYISLRWNAIRRQVWSALYFIPYKVVCSNKRFIKSFWLFAGFTSFETSTIINCLSETFLFFRRPHEMQAIEPAILNRRFITRDWMLIYARRCYFINDYTSSLSYSSTTKLLCVFLFRNSLLLIDTRICRKVIRNVTRWKRQWNIKLFFTLHHAIKSDHSATMFVCLAF